MKTKITVTRYAGNRRKNFILSQPRETRQRYPMNEIVRVFTCPGKLVPNSGKWPKWVVARIEEAYRKRGGNSYTLSPLP